VNWRMDEPGEMDLVSDYVAVPPGALAHPEDNILEPHSASLHLGLAILLPETNLEISELAGELTLVLFSDLAFELAFGFFQGKGRDSFDRSYKRWRTSEERHE